MKKKLLSLLLTITMIVTMMPAMTMTAFASTTNFASSGLGAAPSLDKTLYWGYDDSSKTLYISKTAEAITSAEPAPFDSSIEGGNWHGENNQWLYTSVESVEILNNIAPSNTACWFSVMNKLKKIKGINYLDTSNVTDMHKMFSACYELTEIDLSEFDTSNVKNMKEMFYSCGKLKSLDLSSFNTSKVTDMMSMFYKCEELTELNVSSFDTSNVTDMTEMFYYCKKLTKIDVSKFDTSKVMLMTSMFCGCSSLTSLDVSKFDTSSVLDMREMFFNCSTLTSLDVSKFETSKVIYMVKTFENCKALTSLDVSNFDTSSAQTMEYMFSGCNALTSLDVSNFDTSSVQSMSYMFEGCKALTSLDLSNFKTSSADSMESMLSDCRALTSLDLSSFDTSKVTKMDTMFKNCIALKTLDLSNFDCTKVTSASNMFQIRNIPKDPTMPNYFSIAQLKTPKNFANDVALPKLLNSMIWYDADTQAFYEGTNLPKNLAQSKTLYACAVSEDIVNGTLTVQPSGDSTVIITVTPFEGSEFKLGTLKAIYNDGTGDKTITPTATQNQGEYSFTMPAYPVTVTAEFSKTLYWGYNNGSKTFYLSASADAITDASSNAFDSTDLFSYGENIPWKANNQDIEKIKIIDDITPGKTAFWFKGMNNLTEIEGIEHLDTTNVTDMKGMFDGCSKLESLDVSGFNTSKVTDMNGMFKDCKALTSLDLGKFNTSKVTIMSYMFYGCEKLASLDLSSFDTSNVTDMEEMFGACHALEELDVSSFDTSNVTNMKEMFAYSEALESLDVSNFDTSKVEKMTCMFAECDALTSIDLSTFDMSSVDDTNGLKQLFSLCDKLESVNLSNVDASKVKNMDMMFYHCKALTSVDFTNFKTSSAETMLSMFEECEALTSLDFSSFDTSNVTTMGSMFSGCKKLKSLNLSSFNTSKVEKMSSMFRNCTSLKFLDLSNFDMTKVTTQLGAASMFNSAAITYIKTPKNVQKDVKLPTIAEPMKWLYADTLTEYGDANLPKNRTDSITLVAGVPVSGWAALQEAINNTSGDATTPATKSTTFILSKNLTAPSSDGTAITIPEGKNITIDLNGYVLNRGQITSEGYEKGYDDINDTSAIVNKGELTITDSNTNNQTHHFKKTSMCWVLDEDNGTESVIGGVITGGAGDWYEIPGLDSAAAGGILNFDDSDKLTIEGGNIVGNSGHYYGGGIYGGDVTLKSGCIKGNYANYNGGGIFSSSLTMTGGEISYNYAAEGGGVCTLNSLLMKSGEISNNTAVSGAGIEGYGNNILIGGVIKNNSVSQTGYDPAFAGGIYACEGTYILGGNLVIEGNTQGADNVADDLYYKSGVSVSLADGTDASIPVPKNGFKVGLRTPSGQEGNLKILSAEAGQEKYFFSNNEEFRVKYNSGGYLELVPPPVCEIDGVLYDTIQDAIAACPNYTEKTIKLNTNANISTPIVIPENKNIKINLNGHDIDRNLTEATANGYVIENKGKLTISDSAARYENGEYVSGKITGGNNNSQGGGIYNTGTLTINGGAVSGNKSSSKGGGIYSENGTVTLNGGLISNNTVIGVTLDYSGGGLFLNSGKFVMNGGSIENNSAAAGGGVYSNADGEINGGTIKNNKARTSGGGGYYVGSGKTIVINAGSICNNDALTWGGGLTSSGTIIMTGGSIKDNTAQENGGAAINTDSIVKIYGGEITGNKTHGNSGAVRVNGEGSIIGGSIVIKDNYINCTGDNYSGGTKSNLLIESGMKIAIGTGNEGNGVPVLEDGVHIGVKLGSNTGQFTTNGSATDVKYFYSDDPAYYVNYNSDHLELLAPTADQHTLNFGINGKGTIYANKQAVASGETVELTVVPNDGYILYEMKVTDANGNPVTVSDNKFTMPGTNVTINAIFKKDTEMLKLADALSGKGIESVPGVFELTKNSSTGEIKIKLLTDIIGDKEDSALVVPGGKKIVLDLNGHVIDRGLIDSDGTVTETNVGSAIYVDEGGNLTIEDSDTTTVHKFREITSGENKGLWVLDDENGTKEVKGGVITGGTGMYDSFGGNYEGGAIQVNGGSFSMTGGNICGNIADKGGGVMLNTDKDASFQNVSIYGNVVRGDEGQYGGGGVYTENTSCTMTNCTINNNTAKQEGWYASGYGGGIYVYENSTVTLNNCTISGNTGANGAGIYCHETCIINDTSIKDNTSTGIGGGVSVYYTADITVGGKTVVRGNRSTDTNRGIEEDNINLLDVEGDLVASLNLSSSKPLTSGADIGVTITRYSDWAPGTIVNSYFGETTTLSDSNYKYIVINNCGSENKGTIYYLEKSGSNYVLSTTNPNPDPTPGPGGGGEEETTDDKYKATVTGENSLQVEATIKDGKAVVDEISEETLNEIIKPVSGKQTEDTIVVDLSQAKEKVTAAELPFATLDRIEKIINSKDNNFNSFQVKLSKSTVELDSKALVSTNDQARKQAVEFGIAKASQSELSKVQKDAISELDVLATYDAYIKSQDHRMSEFNGGFVHMSIDLDSKNIKDNSRYQVYSVRNDGSMFAFITEVKNGKLSFKTNRLLDYIVLYDAASQGLKRVFLVEGKCVKKNGIWLKWRKVEGATRYTIYGTRSGKKYQKVKTVKGNKKKLVVRKIKGKKLLPHKIYKFYVVANTPNGKRKCRTIRIITKKTKGEYANVRKVTVKKQRITLNAGTRKKVNATYKVYKNKKHLGWGYGKKFRYYSNNTWVARVSKKGVVKAINPGEAFILIQDISGKWDWVKVTVK